MSALAAGLLSSFAALVLGACVGDDPASVPANSDGGGDGALDPAESGPDGGGDARADAAPPPAVQDKTSWAFYSPTVGSDGSRVAVDPAGYSVVAQLYTGAPPDVTAAQFGGFYVARLDPAGKPVWQKGVPFQGTPPAIRSALGGIAVDAAGDVYLAGSTQCTLDFGGGLVVTGGGQYKDVAFVVKLDRATGAGVWQQTFKSASSEVGIAAIAVRNDSIGLSGNYYDTLSYEKTTGSATAPGTGSFVARLERSSGKAQWLSTATNNKQILKGGITLDDAGDVYAGFWFDDPIVGWGNPAPIGAGVDGLVVAFDGTGNARWKHVFGKAGSDTVGSVQSIAFNAGTIAIVGRTPAGIDFGDGKALGTSGASDPYVATLEPSTGALRWARAIGNDAAGDDDEALSGVAVDDWGQVFVAGRYRRSLVIAGKALPTPADVLDTAAFGAKLDASGTLVWSKAILASSWANAESIAAGPGGNTVATLAVNGSFDLGAGMTGSTPTSNKSLGVVGWTP
ncbi:MAG: hypothetical protein K0S65_880 [Labilithrix sp.]|nr:hypothetical protein [Labilithrix sp.]